MGSVPIMLDGHALTDDMVEDGEFRRDAVATGWARYGDGWFPTFKPGLVATATFLLRDGRCVSVLLHDVSDEATGIWRTPVWRVDQCVCTNRKVST